MTPLPGQDGAGPEIPLLKRQEKKEEEGAAAVLPGACSPGSSVCASGMGSLFATKLGATLTLGGVLAWAVIVSVAVGRLTGGGAPKHKVSPFRLAPPEPAVVLDQPANGSLGAVSTANHGELAFGREDGQALRDAPAQPAEPAAQNAGDVPPPSDVAVPSPPPAPAGRAQQARPQLASAFGGLKGSNSGPGGGSGAQLASAGPGGGGLLGRGSGNFHMKSFNPTQTFGALGGLAGARRRLTALAPGHAAPSSKSVSSRPAPAGAAMAQLRSANTLSAAGSASPTETLSRQYAADAFDPAQAVGNTLKDSAPAGAMVGPGGGVAPLGVSNPPQPEAPPVGPSSNVSPYQSQVDNAKDSGNRAAFLKVLGLMLLLIGIALMLKGASCPSCLIIGAILVAAGIAALVMGFSMAQQGKEQAAQVGQDQGQQEQGATASSCVDRAFAAGKTVDEVCPGGQRAADTSRGYVPPASR